LGMPVWDEQQGTSRVLPHTALLPFICLQFVNNFQQN